MLDNVQDMLQPDLGRKYCDYFFYLMVIYLIIGTLSVADFLLSGVQSIKNFSGFLKSNLPNKLLQLAAIAVHFFVLRLLYSMCYNSLPATEGFTEGNEDKEEEQEDNVNNTF